MKKFCVTLITFISFYSYGQEFNDILRAGNYNNLVNPGYSFIEGKNYINLIDSRFLNNGENGYNLSLLSLGFSFGENKNTNYSDTTKTDEYKRYNHKGIGIDILTYGDGIFKRTGIGLSFGIKSQVSSSSSLLFTMRFSLNNDKGELVNFNLSDPLYVSWMNNNMKQSSSMITPSLILFGENYMFGLSYNKNLSVDKKVNVFGDSFVFSGRYGIEIESNNLDINLNYVATNQLNNISSFMFNYTFNNQHNILIGERNFGEVFVGYGIKFNSFDIDLIYNATVSKKMLENINLYTISLKYDL